MRLSALEMNLRHSSISTSTDGFFDAPCPNLPSKPPRLALGLPSPPTLSRVWTLSCEPSRVRCRDSSWVWGQLLGCRQRPETHLCWLDTIFGQRPLLRTWPPEHLNPSRWDVHRLPSLAHHESVTDTRCKSRTNPKKNLERKRDEASDHCHHSESFEICQCLQNNT